MCVCVRERGLQCSAKVCAYLENEKAYKRHQKEARRLLASDLREQSFSPRPLRLRFVLFTRRLLQKQISSRLLREFLVRILRVSPHRLIHCQKSQSSMSRWLRPDSRLASPEGEPCSRELSKLVMGDTGLSSSGSASEGRRLICLKKGWPVRVVADGLFSGSRCKHSSTNAWKCGENVRL